MTSQLPDCPPLSRSGIVFGSVAARHERLLQGDANFSIQAADFRKPQREHDVQPGTAIRLSQWPVHAIKRAMNLTWPDFL
jgi:hypothetical protein